MQRKIVRKTVLLSGLVVSGLGLSENAHAVRINGQEITFNEDKWSIVYTGEQNTTNIVFEIKGDDITVGSESSDQLNLLPQAMKIHQDLLSQLDDFNTVIGKEGCGLNIEASDVICGKLYLKEDKDLNFTAENSIIFNDVIAEINGNVILTAPELDFSGFFLSTQGKVNFNGASIEGKNSWLSGIEYSPKTSLGTPFTYSFQGNLNMNSPSTDGNFIAVGAKSIEFKFQKI